jgi:choline dehydrogenase
MAAAVTRRAFLAGVAALPVRGVGGRQRPAPIPATVDVVVIGGDLAALAATYRLAQPPGTRVVLLQDAPAWAPPAAAPPMSVADLPPFVRGHAVCFDAWRDRGNPGWGYADVLDAFKALEKYEAGASAHRGGAGPLSVSHCWDPHPLHRTFLMAGVSGGFAQDSRHDFNGPRSQSVAGYYQKLVENDRPQSLDAALVAPAVASGSTHVVERAQVRRLLVDKGRVTGVEYLAGAEPQVVRAERAVILGAAPVRAAQLLLLSGIGPADQLRRHGLAVVADRAGVGANLHDQLRVPVRWQALPPALALPESTVTAGFFTVSLVASPPDLQMDFVDPRGAGGPQLGLDVTLVQPAARGAVTLRTAEPHEAPNVAINPLSVDADVTALVQGVRLARLVGASPQLERFRSDEIDASRAASSTPELQAYVRGAARPRGHLAGTCAMGPAGDPAAVVDASLAVHGVAGLYIVGASVMPRVVNAPPEAAALMIGWRGAGFALAASP